jgi:type I restriction enzyme, S subunit
MDAGSTLWPTTPLGRLAEFRNGVNYDKNSFGEGIKVIGVGDFQDYVAPRYSELKQIRPEGVVTEKSMLRDGDILFVRSNGNPALIGRSLFVSAPPEPVTHSAFTIRLRFASPDVFPRFYAYLFRTSLIRSALSAFGGGTNISNLNQGIFLKLAVPVPPIAVQRWIADTLSAYDDLIENCERRIRVLDETARALYREWFVNFRYPGHEKVPLVSATPGPIPRGWTDGTIAQAAAFLGRGISPAYDVDGPSVVINQKCIRDSRLDLAPARRQSKMIPDDRRVRLGDVLINSTGVGTLGRVAQVLIVLDNHTVDTHVTIARPNAEVDRDYFGILLLFLEDAFERKAVGATGQTELSRTAIGATPFIIPAVDVQRAFGGHVRPMRDETIALQQRASNLRQTRDLLLPRLLSGQLPIVDLAA